MSPYKQTNILLIHNILWSHYKAKVFSELFKLTKDSNLKVHFTQLALTQQIRNNLGKIDLAAHKYPYDLLFEKCYEDIGFREKLLAINKIVKKVNPEVIILPGYNDPVYWWLLIKWKLLNKKIIITADSNYYDHKRVWYKEKFKSFLLSISNLVFCYGTMQIEYLQSLGVKKKKIHIRYQATDNDKIRAEFLKSQKQQNSNRKKTFIYVGRLSPEKNLHALINVFDKYGKDWELLIVGDGPDAASLQKLVKIKKNNSIIFLGSLSWHEVAIAYSKADVFVLPSLSEPWGLVVNEAMLCELPVIVSSHCGCSKDLVHHSINGFTFNPHSEKELQYCLEKFINEEVDLKKMGKASFQIIKKYNPETAAMQMRKGIESLCAKSKK